MSAPPLFDCCTMVGMLPDCRARFHEAAALRRAMDAHRIGRALVCHSVAWLYDFAEGARILEEEIAPHVGLVPCHALVPCSTGEWPASFLRERAAKGPLAVRLYPRTHNFPLLPLDGPEGLLAQLERHRVPTFLDIDECDYRDLLAAMEAHPRLPLVLGNRGTSSLFGIYREFRWIYPLMEKFPSIHIEMSFLIGFRSLEDIAARFGAERILFGSRMPLLEPGSAIARLLHAELSPGQRRLIASENLERLLGEVQP